MVGRSPEQGGQQVDRDETRRRVLAAIRSATAPISIGALARDLDLHVNTVRLHTRALVADGFIEQGSQRTGGKGRPRAVFRPTTLGARSGKRNFELLSTVLVEHVVAQVPDPEGTAAAAGRSFGATLRAATAAGTPAEAVVDLLADLGFEPVPQAPEQPHVVHLHNCPFRELADAHQDVVCAVHRGMLEGMLPDGPDQAGGRGAVTLEPFTSPAVCTVRVFDPSDQLETG
ncbi:helix-turn-helix transcriptional regulator [Granulicoccus sp. GXG6511]|uniref:helix-turn-helix transcriptional regulator n=1 Tax=Granulicoccus sp. GXG6511 TaxID=3381351 RepID=UPI003D7D42F4